MEEPCGNRAKLQGIIPGERERERETPSHLYSQFPVTSVYLVYVDPSVEFISREVALVKFRAQVGLALDPGG